MDDASGESFASFDVVEEAHKDFRDAISQCADVLEKHFPARPGDNPNELSDAVVVLPRV